MSTSATFFTIETYGAAFEEAGASSIAYGSTAASSLSTPNVSYGRPFPEACAKHVHGTYHVSKVYIIASGSLSRDHPEALQTLIDALGRDNVVGVRKGMASHTLWSEVIQIANEARAAKADCLVTLGAGSITDGAKLIALSLANNITTTDQLAWYSVESSKPPTDVKPASVPLICIPTSLSGGEYFSLAGGTDDQTKHKHAFLQPGMGSSLVILDPQLCTLTPLIHWLPTGVRAIDHCIETLSSFQSKPAYDQTAEEGLRLLIPSLLATHQHPMDPQPRHASQLGVLKAMHAVRAGVPMGGSHAIGHQLGPLGVPHGITSCLMCPAVMKYNMLTKHPQHSGIAARQSHIRDILWSLPSSTTSVFTSKGLNESTADLGDLLDALFRALDQPRTLREVGVGPEKIPALAKRTLDDHWAQTNPVPLVSEDMVQEILEMVVG